MIEAMVFAYKPLLNSTSRLTFPSFDRVNVIHAPWALVNDSTSVFCLGRRLRTLFVKVWGILK